MEVCLGKYPFVSVASEFPGLLRPRARYASDDVRLENLKYNVGTTSLIQLGLTLCNSNGTVGGVWQFNFHFNLDRDLHSKDSTDFLALHGIDFQKLKTQGVDRVKFGAMFGAVIGRRRSAIIGRRRSAITWVTFHGVYDYAHLGKAVTFRPAAESSEEFFNVLGRGFNSVVDCKYMAKFYEETGSEIGLQKLDDNLGVKRRGEAHTAASDSLLTALVYFKLKNKLMMLGVGEEAYVDFVYGISTRISRNQKEPLFVPTTRPGIVYYHHHPYHFHQRKVVLYPIPYQQPNVMMGRRWVDCSLAPTVLVFHLLMMDGWNASESLFFSISLPYSVYDILSFFHSL